MHSYTPLASIHPDDMPDGKRIPADKLIESAREHRAEMLKDAESLRQAMEESEEIKKKLKQLEAAMHSLTDHFCHRAKDIYGFNIRVDYR